MIANRLNFLCFLLLVRNLCGLSFLAIGDWGGRNYPPYYTPQQKYNADNGMVKVATEKKSQFILSLGDNFYMDGVESEYSIRFNETFENVYNHVAIEDVPWYIIAGNHDHGGNITGELEYSKLSHRWNFPNLSYNMTKYVDDMHEKTIDFIMIDTMLYDYYDGVKNDYHGNGMDMEKHLAWIQQRLEASTADYILVVGHFPLYSTCSSGDPSYFRSLLNPLLVKHQAHYMAGHDHCQSHVHDQSSGIHYMVSGVGSDCCYPATGV